MKLIFKQMEGSKIRPIALVTGAALRIGKSLSIHLAQDGWDVALHYNSSYKQIRLLQNMLSKSHPQGRFKTFCCDLEIGNQAEELIHQVLTSFGGLDLLVNNASVFTASLLRNTPLTLFQRQMDVNFRAPFILIRDYACNCESGIIVNMLDTRILFNQSHHAAYTLSKKNLAQLTQMAALELGPAFRVNGIAPGAILPPKGEGQEYLMSLISTTPMKETGGIRQVLKAFDYILSSSYVTGEIFYCDGGQHLL